MKLDRRVAVIIAIAALATVVPLWLTANHKGDVRHDDWWSVALPTYLTGIGTLSLAALNVVLLRQQASDNAARVDREDRAEALSVLRNARNVIAFLEWDDSAQPRSSFTVLNATRTPIIDLRLTIWAGGFLKERDFPGELLPPQPR